MRKWPLSTDACRDEGSVHPPGADDLEQIHSYINQDNPAAAARVVLRLIDRAMALSDMPRAGREVDEPGGRVVVVPRLRYFIFYTLTGDEVHITTSGTLRGNAHLGFIETDDAWHLRPIRISRRPAGRSFGYVSAKEDWG